MNEGTIIKSERGSFLWFVVIMLALLLIAGAFLGGLYGLYLFIGVLG